MEQFAMDLNELMSALQICPKIRRSEAQHGSFRPDDS
jgi:hypothetical protein